jgi:hypothetical protein
MKNNIQAKKFHCQSSYSRNMKRKALTSLPLKNVMLNYATYPWHQLF